MERELEGLTDIIELEKCLFSGSFFKTFFPIDFLFRFRLRLVAFRETSSFIAGIPVLVTLLYNCV